MSDVRELLQELADDGVQRGAGSVFEGATRRAAQRRRTQRRVRVASVVGAVVAVVVVVALIAQSSSTGRTQIGVKPDPSTTTVGRATAAQLAAGHWAKLPRAPIKPRYGVSTVWTGSELIVWGGQAQQPGDRSPRDAYGMAYRPATRKWRVLPKSPLGSPAGVVAVWTGTEMVVLGPTRVRPNAAAYNPETNTWRRIPDAPLYVAGSALGVWTGDRVVIFAGTDAASFDPVANKWRSLPKLPTHPMPGSPATRNGVRAAVAVGRGRMIVWSEWLLTPSAARGRVGSIAFRYDEASGRWTELGAGPGGVPWPEEAVWAGDRIVVRGRERGPGPPLSSPNPEVTASYDAETGSGTRLPNRPDALTPDNAIASSNSAVWTGRALWSFEAGVEPRRVRPTGQSNAYAYDAKTDTWRALPPGPPSCHQAVPPIWTGTSVFAYCSYAIHAAQAEPIGGLEFIPG